MRLASLLGVLVVGAAGTASAQVLPATEKAATAPAPTEVKKAETPAPRDWLSRVEIGALAFLFYRYELTEGAKNLNTFDLARMYFFATAKPMDHVKFRVTLDSPNREATTKVEGGVTTVSQNAGKLDIVLKHAYGELYDVLTPGLSVKFGMHDLPWIPFEEKIWTYRLQGPVFADREGYLSSTDLGVGIGYAPPSKWVEGQVSLVNGETWSKPEVSKHKDVHARLTLRPMASHKVLGGLAVNLSGSAGLYASGDDQDRRRFIPQVAYEHKHAAVAAEYLRAWDPPSKLASRHPSLANSTDAVVTAQGWSAFGWLDMGIFGVAKGLRLMARVERLDPDTNLADNGHTRQIVGIGYRASKYVQFLFNGEFVQYEANARAAADERRIFFHTAIGF